MTEHLPECPILKPCCDDEEFPEHGFCGNFVGRCLHCMAECICDALRACEKRVRKDQTDRCVAAFHDRISDSDLDDLLSDDEKDIVAQAIRSARQRP
jgi:hypothetical protein